MAAFQSIWISPDPPPEPAYVIVTTPGVEPDGTVGAVVVASEVDGVVTDTVVVASEVGGAPEDDVDTADDEGAAAVVSVSLASFDDEHPADARTISTADARTNERALMASVCTSTGNESRRPSARSVRTRPAEAGSARRGRR